MNLRSTRDYVATGGRQRVGLPRRRERENGVGGLSVVVEDVHEGVRGDVVQHDSHFHDDTPAQGEDEAR